MNINRRTAWMLGVAAMAGSMGAAVAWRGHAAGEVLTEAEAGFWASHFADPSGGAIDLNQKRGRFMLVNFWATWCPPCVEELPLINAFFKTHAPQGWQVLGLAVDQLDPVRNFLKKLPLDFPVGMAGFAGTELSRTLGNTSGGLPHTVVFGPSGKVVDQKIGKLSPADLDRWARLA